MKTPEERAYEDEHRLVGIPVSELIRGKAITKLKRMIPVMSNTLYPFIKDLLPEDHEYEPEIQEIRRAMKKTIERQHGTSNIKLEKLMDFSSMIMRYDYAYFYYFLDFLNELDMDKLKLPFKDDIEYWRARYNYDFPKEHTK